MHREYEIFEVMPDGSIRRESLVSGFEFATIALRELAKRTRNECFASDAKTRQVVAQLNIPAAKRPTMKRVFQITYDEQVGRSRAELLSQSGFGVVSVVGNDRAKVLLSSLQNYNLFVVGRSEFQHTREEMVDWLRANYPDVKILALNPADQPLAGADFNVTEGDPEHGPENWMSVVKQELAGRAIASSAGGKGP